MAEATHESIKRAIALFEVKAGGQHTGAGPSEPDEYVGWYNVFLGGIHVLEVEDDEDERDTSIAMLALPIARAIDEATAVEREEIAQMIEDNRDNPEGALNTSQMLLIIRARGAA